MPGNSVPPNQPAPGLDLATADFDDLARLFPDWDGRFEQISAGPFRGRLTFSHSRQARAFRVVFNQRVLSRGAPQPGWVDLCPVFASNQETRWQRHRLEPGDLVLRGVGAQVDNLSGRQAELLAFSVPLDLLGRAAEFVPGTGVQVGRGWHAYRRGPASVQGFEQRLRRLLARSLVPSVTADDPERHALEQECLTAALQAIAPEAEPGNGRRQQRREALVRRVEDYLRGHLHDPVGLLDLCAEFRVGARTLQYAFGEHYGLGPIEFLRALRLNAVRADLKQAEADGAAIRTVARRWGYRHLGNFAAEYRHHFGQLPSETLRAARR